jgi:hypothetical protein
MGMPLHHPWQDDAAVPCLSLQDSLPLRALSSSSAHSAQGASATSSLYGSGFPEVDQGSGQEMASSSLMKAW